MKYRFLFLFGFILNHLTAQSVDSIAIKQVDSLIQVSRELTGKRDFDKALQVNAEAEKIALEKLGRESATYGSCAFNRGRVNHFKQDYPEAEKWLLESKAIREKVLGKEHPDYAISLERLGIIYLQIRMYEKAESLFLDCKLIREKVLGKDHQNYVGAIMNLALLYQNILSYEIAEPFYLEAKEYFEVRIKKEDHPFYHNCLNNLAVLYKLMGIYEKAEPLFLKSKDIREKILGKEHPDYVQSLNNIAAFYYLLGNYKKEEALLLEAKEINEKKFGKESLNYTYSLQDLGTVYMDMGDFEKAENLFLEAKAKIEKAVGKEDPGYSNILNNLAGCYGYMEKYEKAEPLFLEAIAIKEKVLGKDHPNYAQTLTSLASLYSLMGNHEKIEPLALESKAILKKATGKENLSYSICLNLLAKSYETQKRFKESELLLNEFILIDQARLANATRFLSERELANYIATFQNGIQSINSFILNRSISDQATLPSLAYNQVLFNKGYLLNAAIRLNTLAASTSETEEINLRLKGYHRRLAIEYTKPLAEQKNIVELEDYVNTAEIELARSMLGYAEATRQIKWEDVMSALKREEAAIEFVSFKFNFPKFTDSIMYAALLIKSGEKQPQFIPLFEEKSLDSLLHSNTERKADYVNELYTLADRGLVKLGIEKSSLYELIWKPLEAYLSGIKTIYYSPSGLLHRINVDAIPVSEMETIADKYQMITLNSTRQIVIPTTLGNTNNDAILFGGIQFEPDSLIQNNEPLLASRSRGELSFTSVDSNLRGGTWNYLAGTEREVNAIEKIMLNSGIDPSLKKGYEATEETFKNIGINNAPSPRILHMATHGYFFPDPKSTLKNTGLSGEQESVFKISDHPMLRSGLIMAGGNAAWQGNQALEGREDGILTAYEISQMNLSNTELVVLSACETGLGDIQGNEGVYGLQRAFKIAGAKYLIMSLWQVPDKQTSLLKTTFYKKWLEEKMDIPEAFHAAQKQLRDNGLDPYNWAAFVLME